jgi:hypothetical protein
MKKWLAGILSSIIASIVAGLVVWHLTQKNNAENIIFSDGGSSTDNAIIQKRTNQLREEENDNVNPSMLIIIGKVTKIYPENFEIQVTYDIATISNKLFVQGKNGKFITSVFLKRYGEFVTATSSMQNEIQTGANVYIRKNM